VPSRIYALAKELKLDTKDLVDICNRAGIPGKGSPLASLEDDEIAKLKAYLAQPTKSSSRGSSVGAPVQPSAPPPPAKPKFIPPVQDRPAPVAPPPPAPVTPAEPEAPQPAHAPATVAASATVEAPASAPAPVAHAAHPGPVKVGSSTGAPVRPAPEAPQRPGFSREDYIPATGGGKVRVLDSRGPKKDGGGGARRDGGGRRAPIQIRLPDMPDVKQPAPQPKAEEVKAQKPLIRLTKDAVRGSAKPGKTPTVSVDDVTKAMKAPSRPGSGGKHSALQDIAAKALKSTTAAGKGGKKTKAEIDEEEAAAAKRRAAGGGLAGMAGDRANRQAGRKIRSVDDVDDEGRARRRPKRPKSGSKGQDTSAPRKQAMQLVLPCTVRTFSEAAGVPSGKVMKTLIGLGLMASINQNIPDEYVELLAMELGVELEFKKTETLEESLISNVQDVPEAAESLEPRPPIVTFLGHVDHGKTSLLDKLIGINVVAGEAGGITQHIRAYQVTKGDRKVSFVDTPGHEAFTEMRARGANVTDIAVLVVAADDGIMPQTEEAISHIKAANVPIVVALNKVDLPGTDQQRILQQLAAHELLPSEWGGNVEVIRTSAITGQGMDDLLDTLLTIADINELKANPNRAAKGTCLEAEQQAGRGVIAKLIVQTGTLNVGDVIVCGSAHGRVKAMYDTLRPNVKIKSAGPSTPVNVTGLDVAPEAGESFTELADIADAREIALARHSRGRTGKLGGRTTKVSLEQFQERLQAGRLGQSEDKITLNLIIRADVRGSIEAILKELGKLEHPEVQVKVLQASVGGITVADVTLANASDAIVVGFNVIPDEAARVKAEEEGVEIRRYDIIYKVADDIKATLSGKLKPEERVVELGRALVKQVFSISRVGTIAGCYVASGSIERGCRIRVNREGRTIGDYALDSLKREKDDAKEVQRGMECGIRLANFNDIKKDDVLEAYKIEEVARSL
jgi:translation initiation factor IF-2